MSDTRKNPDPIHDLIEAVAAYLSEVENPVPDYGYRRVVRDRMAKCLAAAQASRRTAR